MAYTYKDLVDEVKRRAIRNQGGTTFDDEIKLAVNTSLFRVCREALWKPLRRVATFNTETSYSTGSGAVTATNGSGTITVTGATFITDNIRVGRRMFVSGTQKLLRVGTVNSETSITFADSQTYDGTTTSTGTYKIYGTEEYNLPVQSGRIGFLWHEQFGYPLPLEYITEKGFYDTSVQVINEGVSTHYHMWGDDMVLRQPNSGSVMRISSSSSSDTSKNITIFGTVSGYPDYEVITTNGSNGTTAVSGTKTFTSIERVTKDASTVGRITVDCNSAAVTVAVLPVGDSTGDIVYKKVKIFPLPNAIYPIRVQHYKDVWRLVNDGDMHELGGDFDEAIILLATSKVNLSQSKQEADKFFILYKDEILSLKKYNVERNLDWEMRLKRPKDARPVGSLNYRGFNPLQVGGQFGYPMR